MARRKKSKREIPLTHFLDDKTGVAIAHHSNDRPPSEAFRHGDFDRGWQVGRETGDGFRRVDSLTTMHRNGTITLDHLAAGIRFRTLFERASFAGVAAGRLDPTPRSTDRTRLGIGESASAARERIASDIALLGGHGSELADATWWVIGAGLSVEEYARRKRWNGRALNPKIATGLVIGALGVLDGKRHGRPT